MKVVCCLILAILFSVPALAGPDFTNIVVTVVSSTSTNSTLVLAAETTRTRLSWGFGPRGTNVCWRGNAEVSTNVTAEPLIGPTSPAPGQSFNNEAGKTVWQGTLYLRSTTTSGCLSDIWILYQ